jgi:hypothetical protein
MYRFGLRLVVRPKCFYFSQVFSLARDQLKKGMRPPMARMNTDFRSFIRAHQCYLWPASKDRLDGREVVA